MSSEFVDLGSDVYRYAPHGGSSGDNDYKVRLNISDSAANDAAVTAAVSALNTAGKGTLVLEGEGTITGYHQFSAPICIDMVGQYSLLKVDNTTVSTGFEWQPGFDPTTATNYACGTIAAGGDFIDSPNLSVSRDDWVIVWSDDAVSGFAPHFPGGNHYPMEIHRVLGQDGADIFFDDFVWDAMSTNVKIALVPQLKNVSVKNLRVQHVGASQPDFTRFLLLNGCTNALIEDLWFHPDGPGSVILQYSGNCMVQGCMIEGAAKNDNQVYGFVAGVCNNVEFCDSTVKGTRHAFTTTFGATDDATYTYGTQRNVRVVNVQAQASGIWSGAAQPNGSKVMFDTHPASGNVIFQGCVATAPGIQPGIQNISGAFQARGSGTVFQDCKVYSPNNGQAVAYRIHGDKACIRNCSATGGWRGVSHEAGDDLSICGGTYEGIKDEFVWQDPGGTPGNVTIENVAVMNCAFNGTKSLIVLDDGTSGHKILLNALDKHSNSNAIDIGDIAPANIKLYGNVLTGYGAGSVGLTATSDIGGSNDAFAFKNFTDGMFEPAKGAIYCAGASTAQVVTADTWTKLTGFTSDADSRNVTSDSTNDKITIDTDGLYDVFFQVSFAGSNNALIELAVHVNDVITDLRGDRMLNASGDVGSVSACLPLALTAADDVELWVRNSGTSITPIHMQLRVERS